MLEVESGMVLHISDVVLPTGVESVALSHGAEHDLAIANIAQPKGIVDEDAAEGDAADEPKDEDSSES